MIRVKKIMVNIVLPVLILAFGFTGMKILMLSKTAPEKVGQVNRGALVVTYPVRFEDRNVNIHATGTVQPRKKADISSQVSGRVVFLANNFVKGGFFKKNDLLFKIEPEDYMLAAEKSRASVAGAEYELARIESLARIARMEWERMDLKNKEKPNPLVLYEPQIKNARAALAAAKADLKQRLLDIGRTRVYAPFNCRIQSEAIDQGQYITIGKSVAVVSGTDVAEIVVPVPLDDLQWLFVPRTRGRQGGSKTEVSIRAGSRLHTWQGKIDRSLGDVDPKGRMARLVVTVDDPYGHKPDTTQDRMDLFEGMFVDVRFDGKSVKHVVAIPPGALREGSTVWLMNAEGLLEIKAVTVVFRTKQSIFIKGDLMPEDKIVLTRLSGVSDGLKLREIKE